MSGIKVSWTGESCAEGPDEGRRHAISDFRRAVIKSEKAGNSMEAAVDF